MKLVSVTAKSACFGRGWVAPEPEAYSVVGYSVRFPDASTVSQHSPENAHKIAAELNRLHKLAAAKGGA